MKCNRDDNEMSISVSRVNYLDGIPRLMGVKIVNTKATWHALASVFYAVTHSQWSINFCMPKRGPKDQIPAQCGLKRNSQRQWCPLPSGQMSVQPLNRCQCSPRMLWQSSLERLAMLPRFYCKYIARVLFIRSISHSVAPG